MSDEQQSSSSKQSKTESAGVRGKGASGGHVELKDQDLKQVTGGSFSWNRKAGDADGSV